jgi:hypothetical protein
MMCSVSQPEVGGCSVGCQLVGLKPGHCWVVGGMATHLLECVMGVLSALVWRFLVLKVMSYYFSKYFYKDSHVYVLRKIIIYLIYR